MISINKVALDVMRENEGVEVKERIAPPSMSIIQFHQSLRKLQDWADYCALEPMVLIKILIRIFEYMKERNLYMDDTDYFWTSELGQPDRLILTFYYEGRVVGWTASSVVSDKSLKHSLQKS